MHTENTHVLSDVHTEWPFRVIQDSNYAVTRFKILHPALATESNSKEIIEEECSQTDGRITSTTNISSLVSIDNNDLCSKQNSTQIDCLNKSSLTEVESESPETLIDDDGDPILDRHSYIPVKELSNNKRRGVSNETQQENESQKKRKVLLCKECTETVDQSCRTSQCQKCEEKTTIRPMSEPQLTKPHLIGEDDLKTKLSCEQSNNECAEEKQSEESSFQHAQRHKGKESTAEEQSTLMYFLNIKHCLATDLKDVGKQVWHGSLLLCDYIMSSPALFENKGVTELGAGVGLCSIIAAMYARSVYCTDVGANILSLADSNISSAATCPTLPRPVGTVHVKELDWFTGLQVNDHLQYSLTDDDLKGIKDSEILLAADVIYDFDITDAFFGIVKEITCSGPCKTLYIALEKRLVFTVEDLDVTSPVYNYFRLHLEDLRKEDNASNTCYEVTQISTDFPQYFQYSRNKYMELWKVVSTTSEMKS